MRFDKLSYQSTRRSAVGFTLVEMLIVVVVISIMIAILFPVFSKVKETSRQSTSISNLKQISQALSQYQLDHDGHSPSVLFGYAVSGASMQSAYGASHANFPGLYPAYIKDFNVFIDPDNTASPTDATATLSVPTNALNAAAKEVPSAQDFYLADSYDISPAVTSTGGLNTTNQYDAWYELTWTDLSAVDPKHPQLMVPSPPGATFITATTYHANKNGNVLVLFQDGSVHTVVSTSFFGAQGAPYLLSPS